MFLRKENIEDIEKIFVEFAGRTEGSLWKIFLLKFGWRQGIIYFFKQKNNRIPNKKIV